MDIFQLMGSGAVVTLTGLCIKLSNGVVHKDECHQSHDRLTHYLDGKFDDLDKRFDDIKDLIKK